MTPIDWNPIILAIVALISTVIATLAPIMVTAVINAHTARLTQVKMLADNNQDIANGIVAIVQNVYKAFTNSEKFQKAFERLDERLHLPADQTQQLLEQAVSIMTLTWGDEWAKLGGKTVTPITPVMLVMPVTPDVQPTPEEEKPV